jgi:flagellar L-ring protein precursor FlgH
VKECKERTNPLAVYFPKRPTIIREAIMSQASRKFKISRTSSMAGILALGIGLQASLTPVSVRAESLFRVTTKYNSQEPLKPRSLFTPPISREVGDLVTITINEATTDTTNAELKVTRTQILNQNGSTMFNTMVGFMLGKVGLGNGRLQSTLSAPNFNGLNNSNTQDSKAESTRVTNITDSIACQVVQVLPSGDLVVQGQKVLQANKERGNLMVTGIVKPYYLDRNNQISSKQVANFQMLQGGKGVISRQQSDGIANKVYQFFN